MAIRSNAQSMMTTDAYGNPTAAKKLNKRPKKTGLLNKEAASVYGGRATDAAMERTKDLVEIGKPVKFDTKMGITASDPFAKDSGTADPLGTDLDVTKLAAKTGSDIIKGIGEDKVKELGSNVGKNILAKRAAKKAGRQASKLALKGSEMSGSAIAGSSTLAAPTVASSIAANATAMSAGAVGSAGATAAGTEAAKATAAGLAANAGSTGGAAAGGAAAGGGSAAASGAGMGVAAANILKTAGVGVVAEAGRRFGNTKIKNGKEDAGYSLKGASKGANIGAAIGSFIPIPAVGTLVGAGIGAGIGALTGLIKGKREMKKRKKREKSEEIERLSYNKKIRGIKRREVGKASDIDSYKKLLSAAGQYSNGGMIKFKKGGILKYSTLNVKEGMSYLNSLVEPEEKAPSKIFRLKKGGTVKLKPLKVPKIPKKMYKKGGKVSKSHSGCGCTSCMKSMKDGGTPKFRRGGKLDVAKQNVILDGPSHDQKNNTGVAGDKGLPIVKNGEKVAEIESNELVLNAAAVKKIDALKDKIESGDSQAKKDLADLLHKELGENTYDYNKSL